MVILIKWKSISERFRWFLTWKNLDFTACYLVSTLFEIRCIYCVFGHILIFTKSVSMFCLFLRMIKCAQNSWSLPGPEVLSVTKNNLAQVWGMSKVFYIQLNFFTTWKLSPKSVHTSNYISISFEMHNWKLEKTL